MKLSYRFSYALAALACSCLRLSATPSASIGSGTVSPQFVTPGYPTLTASAVAGASYDSNSDSGWVGSGNGSNVADQIIAGHPVNKSRVETRTVVTVSEKNLTASDGLTITDFGGVSTGNYQSNPSPGGEGLHSLTITATASNRVLTEQTSSTIYGFFYQGTTTWYQDTRTAPIATGATNIVATNSASYKGTYIVDLAAPTAQLWPDNNGQSPDPTIQQNQSVHPHVRIFNGSAGQPFSLKAVATAPDTVTQYTATDVGVFGTLQANKDGQDSQTNKVWSLQIPCDAPLGVYTLKIYVNSTDLNGGAWDEIVLDGGTFTVTPGLTIATQTELLSDFGADGYGIATTFSAVQNKKTKAINTNPGSFHLSTTLTTAGPCAGIGTYSPTSVSLTLDPEFSFADSGASPTAHVFVGNAGGSFDLHEGAPLLEVVLPISVVGKTVTVNLSSLGTIDASWTIYVRAHFRYTPMSGSLPTANTNYSGFSSTAASNVGNANASPATLTYLK